VRSLFFADCVLLMLSSSSHLSQTIDEIELSQEEFDRRSKSNVETWVSAHLVPVCHSI